MSRQEKAVFLKQSGERLDIGRDQPGLHHWRPDGVRHVAEKIARAHSLRKELGVSGLTVISGAGNIARGDILKQYGVAVRNADALGRLATIQNTIVIAETLEDLKIPVEIMRAAVMEYADVNVQPVGYSAEKLRAAHEAGKVALIGGGTGENDVTTDNAVVFYAEDYRRVYGGDIRILKGTNVDGVFDANPHQRQDAKRYKTISAHTMLDEYERYSVVDRPSLERLIDSGMTMLVYAEGGHDLDNVLRHDPGRINGASIGTLIVPEVCEPVYY